ncbi:MAG: MFS transporter [Deltaproteobacteria bacterium]|nr:MFS transporter [Deltaproteobacteria bacterium]
MMPLLSVLPGYYAKHSTVSMAAIGTALFIGRLFDAVTDPTIGYLSDKIKTPLGHRKPWMILGSFGMVVPVYLIFTPSPDAGFFYFLSCLLLVYFMMTIQLVPYNAWGIELSSDYKERSKIFSFYQIAGQFGNMVFMLFPLIMYPIFKTSEYNADVLKAIGIMIAVTLPLFTLLTVTTVPKGIYASGKAATLISSLKSIQKNRTFWHFTIGYLMLGIGQGAMMSTLYIWIDGYLKIGSKFSTVLATAFVATGTGGFHTRTFFGLHFWPSIGCHHPATHNDYGGYCR